MKKCKACVPVIFTGTLSVLLFSHWTLYLLYYVHDLLYCKIIIVIIIIMKATHACQGHTKAPFIIAKAIIGWLCWRKAVPLAMNFFGLCQSREGSNFRAAHLFLYRLWALDFFYVPNLCLSLIEGGVVTIIWYPYAKLCTCCMKLVDWITKCQADFSVPWHILRTLNVGAITLNTDVRESTS